MAKIRSQQSKWLTLLILTTGWFATTNAALTESSKHQDHESLIDELVNPEQKHYASENALQYLNIYPRQQAAENYLTNNYTIGGVQVTNATLDLNSPYSVVNEYNCTGCSYYFTSYHTML